jgi:hypothetical protein
MRKRIISGIVALTIGLSMALPIRASADWDDHPHWRHHHGWRWERQHDYYRAYPYAAPPAYSYAPGYGYLVALIAGTDIFPRTAREW